MLVHGDEYFIVGGREERKHALNLLRGVEQSCNSGSGVVTVSDSQLLGRTLTLRQWRIEYDQTSSIVFRALNALGLTDARGVSTLGTDDVGGPQSKPNQ